TLPQSSPCSTIGAGGLNDRVRDGIGCGPSAIVTRKIGERKPLAALQIHICDAAGIVVSELLFHREESSVSLETLDPTQRQENAGACEMTLRSGQAERLISTG